MNQKRGRMAKAIVRLKEPTVKRAVVAIVVAILGAVIFLLVLLRFRPLAELWDWLISLMATLLAALFAIGVFEYQSWRTERDRQDRLLEALSAELQSNLDILRHEHRTPFVSQGKEPGSYVKYATAKLVPLDPIVVVEIIRSGVFDGDDVYLLTRIARTLQLHNTEVDYLQSLRSTPGPARVDAVSFATKELDQRQEKIETLCKELIAFLRSEGVRMPKPAVSEVDTGSSSA